MNSNRLHTPIAFFFFNRPDTAYQVFECIKGAQPEKLYLISDGPRASRDGEKEKVEALRAEIESRIDWDCEVIKDYAPENMGCHKRIASGITNVFKQEETAIILEDDVYVRPSFFPFCEELLERYKDTEEIFFISGANVYQDYRPDDSYIITKFPSIWGWATWKRAWDKYTDNPDDWFEMKKHNPLHWYYGRFLGNVLSKYFEDAYVGKIDTWDYQWEASRMKYHGLGIVPTLNMMENIGFNRDDSTHTNGGSIYDFTSYETEFPLKHPSKDASGKYLPDSKYDKGLIKNVEMRSYERMYFWGRVKRRLRMLFKPTV